MGDRAAHLAYARARLGALPGTRLLAASSVDETAPIGPVAQPAYLNQMVLLETSLRPAELLAQCRTIEAERGRERRERWGPNRAGAGPDDSPSRAAEPRVLASRDRRAGRQT